MIDNPNCPDCDAALSGVPIAAKEGLVGIDFIDGAMIKDGSLVLPAYAVCGDCGKKVPFKGAEDLVENH